MNINTRARNVSINNGVVYINGKRVDTKDEKQITIIVEGNCESVDADACERIEVKGDVKQSVQTMSGSVYCKDIHGSANTMSGNINAQKISGDASTMSGNISR